MTERHLCANCLDDGAMPYPVGLEQGTQRDPYHVKHDLCTLCAKALDEGDFEELHDRFTTERTVRRS